MQRKLAAILAADVVGYSRLIAEDEARTLDALRALRRELFEPLIAEHRGEVVKRMGDGWLVSFGSVVDAAQCAIEAQERLTGHDRIKLRIGVHLGDIVHEDEDIYGDGVNIAARLQEAAEPGGVLISGTAYDSVVGRLDTKFEDAGEPRLKNVTRTIRVWRWNASDQPFEAVGPGASEAISLVEKPSIAVLPFANLSNDPDQGYFADGISEDIIMALSKFRSFFVTARNSTFFYKGSSVDIRQIGSDLGVRYVLEGSVRKSGQRVRVAVQLVEAESGNHVWAERYDRQLEDIFELQDEITLTIASTVGPELEHSERERALSKSTEDLGAWDLFQRGLAKIWLLDKENLASGADLMMQAIAKDPQFGLAYSYLALVDYWSGVRSYVIDTDLSIGNGIKRARKALSIDPYDYIAHWALGRLLTCIGNHEAAIKHMETSISINPNFASGYNGLSLAHMFAGNFSDAIDAANVAITLSPRDPLRAYFYAFKGISSGAMGDFENAIELLTISCSFSSAQSGSYMPYAFLAAFYALAGRSSDAYFALENARRIKPDLMLADMKHYLRNADRRLYETSIKGSRLAGLGD